MRTARARLLLLAAGLLAARPAAAQQRMVIRPEPGTPVVAVEVLIAAGPADEPEGKAGLANLSARTVVGPIVTRLDSLGAHLDITARKDALGFTLIASPDVWEAASRLLLVALFRDPPEKASMAAQQRAITAELLGRATNPADAAVRAADAAVYGEDHPWGRSTVGSPESVKALTMEDVDEFLRTHVTSRHAVIAVVGPVDAAMARTHLLGYLDPNSPLPPQEWPRPEPADSLVSNDYNSITTWVTVSYPFPVTGDVEAVEFLARLAMDELSFSPRRSSVFDVSSEVISRRAGGELRFQVVTPPEEALEWASRVRTLVEDESDKPMLPEVFQNRLRRFRGERLHSLESPEQRAAELARQLLVTGRTRALGVDLQGLTLARVHAAVRSLGTPTVVLLGPVLNEAAAPYTGD
jgi:predicted Zn-dependent peptidase